MSENSIENAFIKQFEAEVHLAYQQTGTKLRQTVRNKSNVVGAQLCSKKLVEELLLLNKEINLLLQ